MNVQMSKCADMQMKGNYVIETFKVATPCYTAYIRTFTYLLICTFSYPFTQLQPTHFFFIQQ